MKDRFDVVVVGAGPAGSSAALAAARHGLSVALIDEERSPGGQVYRALAPGLAAAVGKMDDDQREGDRLRRYVAASGVTFLPGRRVWHVAPGFRIDCAGAKGNETISAARLIAATGAHERVVPFEGWTLPGVIGLAAATILVKSQGMIPGPRVVVAGCGPLLMAVAAKIATAGGELVAVVDLSGRSDWLQAAPALARRPRLLRRGARWMLDVQRSHAPVYWRHGLRRASGNDRVEKVTIGPVDKTGAPAAGPEVTFEADVLVVGHGLVPGAEISRLLRASMAYEGLRGGWVARLDPFGRTSIPGLYTVGDGAGIHGAEPAALAGEVAGVTVALDAGVIAGVIDVRTHALEASQPLRALDRYRPFADTVAGLMALRPAHVDAIPPETVVCRCEDVTRAEIDRAAKDDAADVNQLKHFTRCGMGPCQGRMCGDVAAQLLADARGVPRDAVGFWTGRPPLRPVPLADLVGAFAYSDIPIPKPAPL